MGRRSLPKVNPTIDLSRHHRELTEIPEGTDVKSFFADPALPLEVEVGSGKGLFLASASRAYPEHNFLGIEIAAKYARFAASKLAKENRANGVMLHGDARLLFAKFLPNASCAAVHVYFPDPWWKARHRKRRIVDDSFVKEIERVLSIGGLFHFWTDVEEYFHSGLETIAQASRLTGPFAVPELPAEHDLDYRTHFERRMRMHEVNVWRAEFRKTVE